MSRSTFVPFLLMTCAPVLASETTVKLDTGWIEGSIKDADVAVRVFKGIPFAAPPVGENRWKEPQPVASWEGVRTCLDFSPACPQPDVLSRMYGVPPSKLDEDCLYLNVFAPTGETQTRRPVMVWFYGGGFSVGDAATYDMSRLAQLGVVVVTMNYRVGVFGFLAHESLTRESPHASSGNYGLLDMMAGLHWVRRNIAAFGGDPGNVTIFGQSAGASGVCHLMASPRTAGLFQRAISQSSGAQNPDSPLQAAERNGALFFSAIGCADAANPLEAARARPWQEILEASQTTGVDGARIDPGSKKSRLRFGPSIDGWFLVDITAEIFANGREQNVPLLVGSNADESDQAFTAGARYFAATHSRINRDVYRYFFTQKSKDPVFGNRGAVHAAEIAYVTRGNSRIDAHFEPQDWALSEVISKAWVQFARAGDPNLPGQSVAWPRYDAATDPFLELGPEIKQGMAIRSEICDRVDAQIAEAIAKRKESSL